MRNLTVSALVAAATIALLGATGSAQANPSRTLPPTERPVVKLVTGYKTIGFTIHWSTGKVEGRPAIGNALTACRYDREGHRLKLSSPRVVRCGAKLRAEYAGLAVLRDSLRAAATPTTVVRTVEVIPRNISYGGDPRLVLNPPGELPYLASMAPCQGSGWMGRRLPAWDFPVLTCF